MYKVISLALLASQGVSAHKSKVTDIATHKTDYKPYNCWECFEARGKMCQNNNKSKHKRITKNSNMGHGICCKPGSTNRNCRNGRTSVCSEPSILQESGEEDDEAHDLGRRHHAQHVTHGMLRAHPARR